MQLARQKRMAHTDMKICRLTDGEIRGSDGLLHPAGYQCQRCVSAIAR
ncbi:hypothetical protein EPYR_01566 [Erwinia pyrifoliae DSM 12163]|nr:hypothetical protein EJP617_32470 [Erwinia sp. Ejp617]CAY73946.1 hypothetical protein EPYR_01566 [Erwinia pyrifoliae DSM 12163]